MKKFGTSRAGTGVVDSSNNSVTRWATSAADQVKAAGAAVTLNVKRVPVNYIKEDEHNPRKMQLGSADIKNIAKTYPIDRARLNLDDDAYLAEYLELVKPTLAPQGRAVDDFASVAAFAFALKSGDRLLHPVVVWQNDTQFHLVTGERRFLAHLLLGEEAIDARIRDSRPSNLEKYLLQWQENIHRDDLSLFEKIENLRQLADAWKQGKGVQSISISQFTSLSGLARSAAQRYLAVIRCPSKLLIEAIEAGNISNIQQAARIAALPVKEIEATLAGKTKSKNSSGLSTSLRVGRAQDYRAVTFLVRAAAEKLDDEKLTAALDDLDLARQKDLNKAFEILLQRIEELKVDG